MKKIILLGICAITLGCLQASAADAKENWTTECTKCHGADGKGGTTMGKKLGVKDYSHGKVQAELKDEAATKAIKSGVKDKDGKEVMKGYSDKFSDDDVKALVAYMRTFKK